MCASSMVDALGTPLMINNLVGWDSFLAPATDPEPMHQSDEQKRKERKIRAKIIKYPKQGLLMR